MENRACQSVPPFLCGPERLIGLRRILICSVVGLGEDDEDYGACVKLRAQVGGKREVQAAASLPALTRLRLTELLNKIDCCRPRSREDPPTRT
jgi:hypothetical protein